MGLIGANGAGKSTLMKAMLGLIPAKGKIIATHDLDLVLETCDRVLVLNQGKLVVDGSVRDILWNRKPLEKYNLELPFCLAGVPERFSEKALERKCFFQQPWLFFIKSEILKSDDLKNLSECCLSLKTGGMDGKKKRDNR